LLFLFGWRERLGQGKAVRGKKRKEEYNEITM